jgi:outer membrane protein assembly factor BamD
MFLQLARNSIAVVSSAKQKSFPGVKRASTISLTLPLVGILWKNLTSIGEKMKKISIALLAAAIGLPGCSSISMPSAPWFKSAAPVDPTAEALFAEGNRYFNEKKYARAIDVLQKLKSGHPFSPLLTETELKVADAYYLNQQYPEAITAFKEFQTLHPTNENISFVILRLGQAHLDQFTSIDRDQKNTEIAKGYFETVITNHPKSPHAREAAEKLAKCIQYLSEHEFNVAVFYHQQEKFPAARDRFEEIVRKYKGTPTAIKSLYYLGESYRKEKNWVRASLAYEALIQHYPETKFAVDAKTQLAQLDKEKQDPLALLLMRDRRPGAAPAPETKEEPALSKLKDLNLVAKKDLVYEEPGDEKGILRRVADKLNPFSSDGPKESATELLVKRKEAETKESSGLLSSIWPFGRQSSSSNSKPSQNTGLVDQIDDSLKQKGIDTVRQTSPTPPAANLPKNDEAPPQTMDTGVLLGSIDSNLQKGGKTPQLPPAPEAAAAFKDPPAAQDASAKATAQPQSPSSSGLLSSIDQKLKSQGLEPSQFELPPSSAEVTKSAVKSTPPAKVELEPKVSAEKGPLFLAPADLPSQTTSDRPHDADNSDTNPQVAETPQRAGSEAPRNLVRGPIQSQPANRAIKPAEQKKPAPGEEETKGWFDSLRDDVENASKILNPFRW